MKQSAKANMLIVIGGLLAVTGIVLLGTYGLIFQSVLENAMVIEEGTEIFETWIAPPVPVSFAVYLFNVTNADDVISKGAYPIVKEIGPYTYTEIWNKQEVSFSADGGTVEYSDMKTYSFDAENSNGTEDDKITTGNFIMILLAATLYDNKKFSNLVWPQIEKQMDVFETHTVGELLFYGYELPEFHFPLLGLSGTLYDIMVDLGLDPPPIVENNKFALLAMTNATMGGKFKVNTGADGMEEYLFIQEYNGQEELEYWGDPFCNMINGSDGTQFPPFRKKEDTPRLFIAQFCRSLYFEYERDEKVWDKVKTHKYIPPPELLEDPRKSDDNACYCNKVYEYDEEECLGNSFLNLAPCAKGLPLILSTPHFFQGDQVELAKIEGLHPDKDLHQTFLCIDPITGVVMSAAKRIQFNLPLRKYGKFRSFKHVSDAILPILWVDESADISEEDAETLAKLITIVYAVGYTVLSVIMVIGIIMVIFGIKMDKHVLRF